MSTFRCSEMIATLASMAPDRKLPLRLDDLDEAHEVVVHVTQVDHGHLAEVGDLPPAQGGDGLPARADGLAELEQHPCDGGRAGVRCRCRPYTVRVEHGLLEPFEALLDDLGQVEVPLDEEVEEDGQEEPLVRHAVVAALAVEAARQLVGRQRVSQRSAALRRLVTASAGSAGADSGVPGRAGRSP